MERYEKTLQSEEFRTLLTEIIQSLRSEFDNSNGYMELTIGMNENGNWNYQTGDNSFSGGAYGFPVWGVTTIDKDTDIVSVIDDLIDQINDQFSQLRGL